MTVAALSSKKDYIENGVTLAFAVPFRFLTGTIGATRVLVDGTVVPLTSGVDFTTTGGSTDAGGTLTLNASIAGAKLRIRRVTPRSQPADYTVGDAFPAESHERALDRSMLVDQEQDATIADTASRALMVPDGEAAPVLPARNSLIGKLLGFGLDGTIYGASGAEDGGLRSDLALPGLGGSLIAFIASGANAVLRNILSKLRERITPEDFGAVGDANVVTGAGTDDTAAINAFLTAISTGKFRGRLRKRYRVTTALTVVGNDLDIRGEGDACFVYTGASTTTDIFTVGDGLTTYDRINLRDFRIIPTVQMTAGWGLRVKSCRAVDIDVMVGDEYAASYGKVFNGCWFDGVTDGRTRRTGLYTSNHGLRVHNGFEIKLGHIVIKGNSANRQGTGLHIGGNVGGLYTEHLQMQFYALAGRVANDIVATGNQQIFFGTTSTFDVCDAGIEIEDGVVNPVGKYIELGCWVSSVQTNKPAFRVKNWGQGKVAVTTFKSTNNSGDVIYLDDANSVYEIGADMTCYRNTGYAINAPVSVVVRCLSDLNNLNSLGIASTVSIQNDFFGKQKFIQDPTKQYALDFSDNQVTVANGGSAVLAVGSGKLLIANFTNGEIGEYNVGGAGVQAISLGLGGFVATTTTPAAGKVSVAYDGANYRIYNNAGGARTFGIGMQMVRNSN